MRCSVQVTSSPSTLVLRIYAGHPRFGVDDRLAVVVHDRLPGSFGTTNTAQRSIRRGLIDPWRPTYMLTL
ncbi:MAG: hypothetical protein EOM24_01955 [Chloroflexia bacterium]|nr:hypothetical protein [Chloroflexia bacterium]